jgi:hypothetical protein
VQFNNTKNFTAATYSLGSNKVNVVVNSAKPGPVTITVVSLQGSIVKQTNIFVQNGSTAQQLALPQGIYIIKLANSDGTIISQKVFVE